MAKKEKLSPVEKFKEESDALRGTLAQSLKNELTGAVAEADKSLIKFHGIYEQDNRDRREERAAKKLERDYSFMIRLRLPGGLMTSEQWIATDDIAEKYSTGVIKITTRQTLQLHGIVKTDMKPTLQWFDKFNLDSIAACGDVNRNVVCSAHPMQSEIHQQVFEYADKISTLLLPKTRAYYEVWLDDEKIIDKKEEEDPLYGKTYLPRKFKIAIAIPPNNDVDLYANDIGLIAVIENNVLKGFNIAVGGGMSATHGNVSTYPRVASVIGFADTEEKVLKAVYEIVTIQRDYGNRSDRKLARLKYTIDNEGLDWFVQELEKRCGFALEPTKQFDFNQRIDYYGWQKNHEGKWYYTLFVENGRVCNENGVDMRKALYEIAQTAKVTFRFTCNQNLIVGDISQKDKAAINKLLAKYNLIEHTEARTGIRKNSMACVAMPTCPLALAEAQRYLPELISKIEPLLAENQLTNDDIIIRMTGCPNGCARPYLAEIALVGVSPGRYNLHIGGDVSGARLNIIFRENQNEEEILYALGALFKTYAEKRNKNEAFGDFVIREKYVTA
ncbi:MAG TPA: NADPH-dependent assimilatory sulfite reductase hemoprotein subunit [Chitinophagales bacterium]|nr:NADPH-dependent assimilatory sulfite reductase hemoprotein subunit [Chitinophagales bacterium]